MDFDVKRQQGDGTFHWRKHYYGLCTGGLFLSAVWTFILTAPIHRGSIGEQVIYPNLFWRRNTLYILDGLSVSTFSAKLHFRVNGSFKVGTWAISRDQNILESWVLEPQSKFLHSNVLATTHNSNVFYKAQRIQFPLQGKHKCTCSVWRRVCDLCNKCNV